MGFFSKLQSKLAEPPEAFEARSIKDWCDGLGGITPIVDAEPRTRARVAGVVQSIKVVPGEDTSTLEVSVYDGTGEVIGVWVGRKRIKGIDLGAHIAFEGTLGEIDAARGTPTLKILNPSYDLLPAVLH